MKRLSSKQEYLWIETIPSLLEWNSITAIWNRWSLFRQMETPVSMYHRMERLYWCVCGWSLDYWKELQTDRWNQVRYCWLFWSKGNGRVTFLFGVKIIQDHKRGTIWLGQPVYTESILQQFNMEMLSQGRLHLIEVISCQKGIMKSYSLYFDQELY